MVNVVGLPYVIPDRSCHKAAKRVMSRPALTGRVPTVGDSGSAAARAKIGERTIDGPWRIEFEVPNS